MQPAQTQSPRISPHHVDDYKRGLSRAQGQGLDKTGVPSGPKTKTALVTLNRYRRVKSQHHKAPYKRELPLEGHAFSFRKTKQNNSDCLSGENRRANFFSVTTLSGFPYRYFSVCINKC